MTIKKFSSITSIIKLQQSNSGGTMRLGEMDVSDLKKKPVVVCKTTLKGKFPHKICAIKCYL